MQGVAEPAAQKGIIPRAFEHIFESIQVGCKRCAKERLVIFCQFESFIFLFACASQCAENTKFLVRTSYLEIYNEEIRDLLGNDTKQKLEVSYC